MKKKKRKVKRRPQVTCLCGAYGFPHRLSSGRCNGSEWAASYFEYERDECKNCKLNADTYCEAAAGQEKIRYCEGFQDHLRAEPAIRHPLYEKRLEDFIYPRHDYCCDEDVEGLMLTEHEIPF